MLTSKLQSCSVSCTSLGYAPVNRLENIGDPENHGLRVNCAKELTQEISFSIRSSAIKMPKYFQKYKRLRNRLNSDLQKAKQQYYKLKFSSISTEPKIVWNLERTIVGNPSPSIPDTLKLDGREYSNEFLAQNFKNILLCHVYRNQCMTQALIRIALNYLFPITLFFSHHARKSK